MNDSDSEMQWMSIGFLAGLVVGGVIASIVTVLHFKTDLINLSETGETIEMRDARYKIEKVQERQWTDTTE